MKEYRTTCESSEFGYFPNPKEPDQEYEWKLISSSTAVIPASSAVTPWFNNLNNNIIYFFWFWEKVK
jgi:hypothetical protein